MIDWLHGAVTLLHTRSTGNTSPEGMWHNPRIESKDLCVRRSIANLLWLPLALLLANCGGGSSESGGGITTGGTPFTGLWQLIATISVNVGGTESTVSDTSLVFVRQNGAVEIRETDAECSINIGVNGNILTYQTSCIFPVSTENVSTSCTLTFTTRAVIRGTPGSANLSSSFGPETQACRGVAAAYSGNLVGTQHIPEDDADDDGDTDDGTGDGDDET